LPKSPTPCAAKAALKALPGLPALLALAMGMAASIPEVRAQEVTAEVPSDSAAYEAKRRKVLEASPDVRQAAILEAADELARDGFHAEALELVYDLEYPESSDRAEREFLEDFPDDTAFADPPPLTKAPTVPYALRDLRSYVRSSLEYDDWDENPIGGEVRAKLEWDPPGGFFERITPTFSGSDRRAFMSLSGLGTAFSRALKVEGEGLAEKKLWQAYGDSLDRLSLWVSAEGTTRPLGRAVSMSLPVRAELEEYREDRLGLLSRRGFGASPTVEAVSSDWRKSLLLSWEARGWLFPSSRSSDFLRHGPVALANWYADRFTLEAEGQAMDDRYRRDTSMFQSFAWEGRGAAFAKPFGNFRRFKAGLRLTASGERSRYLDTLRVLTPVIIDSFPDYDIDTLTGRYDLEGTSFSVQPVLTLEWASIYSASLSLAWQRGRYPLIATYGGRDLLSALYIDESFTAWKPEAVFSILSRRVFLNASVGYEMHEPMDSPHYYQRYHEAFGMGASFSLKLSPWVELDFSGLWRAQTRGIPTTAVDILSISAGFISRFQ
jgi:hypothetical protein